MQPETLLILASLASFVAGGQTWRLISAKRIAAQLQVVTLERDAALTRVNFYRDRFLATLTPEARKKHLQDGLRQFLLTVDHLMKGRR